MVRLLIPILLLAYSPPAGAAWITIRNDMPGTVIVQELKQIGGKVVPGKPVKLLPGETYREFQPAAARKTLQVLDGGTRRVLTKEDIAINNRDLKASIRTVKGQVKLVIAPTEQRK